MGTIINSSHSGLTISYNGLQFGGNDGPAVSGRTIRCDLPDNVALTCEPIWDESGRTVKWLQCRLSLQTCFYADSETALRLNMDVVQRTLETPRRPLKINGLGLGFANIIDLNFGPKPEPLELSPLGELACRAGWGVNFWIAPCALSQITGQEWTELVWSTSWQNDFEGVTVRTIQGHVGIVGGVGSVTAEQARTTLNVVCPNHFRRLQNVWQESTDRRRVDFVVVDEQLRGDAYPEGITAITGQKEFSTQAAQEGGVPTGAFPTGTAGISVSMTTAPGRERGYAGVLFFKMMLAKQQAIVKSLQGKKNALVIPASLSIRNGAWDASRQTQCSASWVITACLNDMLAAAGIWDPLDPPNYTKWRTSIQHLWDNRGTSGIGTLAGEDLVINVCNGVRSAAIGRTDAKPLAIGTTNTPLGMTCGEIPPDGGWLQYDVQVRVVRTDDQTWHKRAVAHNVGSSSLASQGDGTALGGPQFQMAANQQHVAETHGLPETYVVLKFKGLRVKHWPVVPELLTVGGKTAVHVTNDIERPKVAYRLFGCPVFFRRGVRVYRVNDYVASYKKNPNESDCSGEINQTGNY